MSDAFAPLTPPQSPPPPGGNREWTWAARLEFSFVHPVCQSMHALTQAPLFIVYRVLEPLLTRHRYSQHFFKMSSQLGTVDRK